MLKRPSSAVTKKVKPSHYNAVALRWLPIYLLRSQCQILASSNDLRIIDLRTS